MASEVEPTTVQESPPAKEAEQYWYMSFNPASSNPKKMTSLEKIQHDHGSYNIGFSSGDATCCIKSDHYEQPTTDIDDPQESSSPLNTNQNIRITEDEESCKESLEKSMEDDDIPDKNIEYDPPSLGSILTVSAHCTQSVENISHNEFHQISNDYAEIKPNIEVTTQAVDNSSNVMPDKDTIEKARKLCEKSYSSMIAKLLQTNDEISHVLPTTSQFPRQNFRNDNGNDTMVLQASQLKSSDNPNSPLIGIQEQFVQSSNTDNKPLSGPMAETLHIRPTDPTIAANQAHRRNHYGDPNFPHPAARMPFLSSELEHRPNTPQYLVQRGDGPLMSSWDFYPMQYQRYPHLSSQSRLPSSLQYPPFPRCYPGNFTPSMRYGPVRLRRPQMPEMPRNRQGSVMYTFLFKNKPYYRNRTRRMVYLENEYGPSAMSYPVGSGIPFSNFEGLQQIASYTRLPENLPNAQQLQCGLNKTFRLTSFQPVSEDEEEMSKESGEKCIMSQSETNEERITTTGMENNHAEIEMNSHSMIEAATICPPGSKPLTNEDKKAVDELVKLGSIEEDSGKPTTCQDLTANQNSCTAQDVFENFITQSLCEQSKTSARGKNKGIQTKRKKPTRRRLKKDGSNTSLQEGSNSQAAADDDTTKEQDKRPKSLSLVNKETFAYWESTLNFAKGLLARNWKNYLNHDIESLQYYEMQNAREHSFNDATVRMLSDPNLHVWQLVEDISWNK